MTKQSNKRKDAWTRDNGNNAQLEQIRAEKEEQERIANEEEEAR